MAQHTPKDIDYRVTPGGFLTGTIRVPGDKSISHRAIILGAVAEGITELRGLLEGEDVLATIRAMRGLGVRIEGPEAGHTRVHGVGLSGLRQPSHPLDLGNSGTSMRLLAGLLCAQNFSVVLTGDGSLRRRPMQRITDPLCRMGASVSASGNGTPPLQIEAVERLSGIHYHMPVPSAQVKSALLLAGLYAQGETCVSEPAPTRDHTERMLCGFGYTLDRSGNTVCVRGGGRLHGKSLVVPGDLSSAAYFIVGATISGSSHIRLQRVGLNPTRAGVISILRDMGADIEVSNPREVGGEPVADLVIRSAQLQGITIPEDQVPLAIDEFPVILMAAAYAKGETVLRGAEELRVKESDRIASMAVGLQALGIDVVEHADGLTVRGGTVQGGEVDSHGDHRVAMAFAVGGIGAHQPITIRNCKNVTTSFPRFDCVSRESGLDLVAIERNA